ncbi:hypothetical protein FRB93_011830 [Tulasnella sp. JGI-2019a]|nr:hypothetical protein FRB93_011830 [Tulasnella sp. JGI-2019a]
MRTYRHRNLGGFSMTVYRLLTIARTFPKLEKLEISWDGARCPYSVLQTLGDDLPHLRHLKLSMDVLIASLSEALTVTAPTLSLTTLGFQALDIQPAAIDRFITYTVAREQHNKKEMGDK